MSLLSKLLGRHESDPYAQGLALYEEGRFAEAAARLREAAQRQRRSAAGSLAAFYQRQALVAEGRRLLLAGAPAAAIPFLAEAVAAWETFPDLHFLLGLAQGLSGAWDEALQSSARALRRNADYVEARLLEAAALVELGRRREAAASLDKLLESGRRVDHPLIEALARPGGYAAEAVPGDLAARLRGVVAGASREGDMAAAVALCRSGRWAEGVVQLRALCAERPDYPDYRVKLAAALFQTGADDEALREVEQALARNPRYRTAAHLKALILADAGRYAEAWAVIAAHPPSAAGGGNPHEALFATYLAGVLSLLTGDPAATLKALEEWGDLTLTFPRGELLRAAAESLLGRAAAAGQRLAALAAGWPGESDYQHFLVCELLARGDLPGAERALGRWPGDPAEPVDDRPLLLAAALAVGQGRSPQLPPPEPGGGLSPAARWLQARADAARGDWAACAAAAEGLWADGFATEPLVRLWLAALVRGASSSGPRPGLESATGGSAAAVAAERAAAEPAAAARGAWRPPAVVPEAAVPSVLGLLYGSGRAAEAEALGALYRQLHGEDLRWTWLWPEFWLRPIRRWIG